MVNRILIGLLVCAGIFNAAIAQNVNMGDAGYPQSSPIPCNTFSDGSTPNFFDNGGSGGNYTANYNGSITFCPDLNQGTKATVVFATNAGFSWNVDASDFVKVYDGPSTASPLLGMHNSITDPNGFTYTASWNNTSGCLTVEFISNGAVEGSGWEANVSCGNINQPFESHIEAFVNGQGTNALNPIDTGFVDVCFGDSILFVAKPLFPNSLEATGYGYSQNVGNVTYEWNVTDGGTYPNNDSIWFTPPARSGYLVDMKITDAFPQSQRMICKVRVSQLPSFAGTGPVEDTVCLGQSTNLIGGVTPTDTVGIDIPEGTFNLGGSFAGLTYLPDGSGAQYQAPITISGFPNSSVIYDPQSLNQVCITMEHSYLGDLEIALQCPNGTIVPLVNSYSPGFVPGGFGGGGTYLGDADDNSGNGVPGIGWEYCFSSVFNDWGTMGTELAGGNTVPGTISGGQSMNPDGVYLPEQTLGGFAGCPVNGVWTIIVQDNLGIDDGYIFEWGLYFDASYFPGLSGYQNYVVNEYWGNDPTIISGQNDTLLVVQPNTVGDYSYTYYITDDFGCNYDTTVTLNVLPLPEIFNDTLICGFDYWVSGTQAFNGGTWSCADTAVHFMPNANTLNPQIVTSTQGEYTIEFTDAACNQTVSAVIDWPPYVYTEVIDTVLCEGTIFTLNAQVNAETQEFIWNTGETGPSITINEAGDYIVTASNECYSYADTATIESKICSITAPNVIVLSSTVGNNVFFVNYDGVKEFNCSIINRWGNLIYEYSDPAGQWDGKSDGKTVEEGVYFYIIKAVFESGEEVKLHGFVQVIY